ncbi:MAG TPA: serpin family protein, partial [Euzebya sp.]|nr:serpin family protein [Euzebya sp.]
MLTRLISLLMALSVMAMACSPTPEDEAGDRGPADGTTGTGAAAAGQSEDIALDLVVDLAGDDAAAVGQAVNAFGFDLLTQLTDGSETVVTSPLSIATMLAMVLAGAG